MILAGEGWPGERPLAATPAVVEADLDLATKPVGDWRNRVAGLTLAFAISGGEGGS
jgi:hypothetical protein